MNKRTAKESQLFEKRNLIVMKHDHYLKDMKNKIFPSYIYPCIYVSNTYIQFTNIFELLKKYCHPFV